MEDINRTLFLKKTAQLLKSFYSPENIRQLQDYDFFLIHFIMQSRGEIAAVEPCKYNQAMRTFFKHMLDFYESVEDGLQQEKFIVDLDAYVKNHDDPEVVVLIPGKLLVLMDEMNLKLNKDKSNGS